MLKTWLPLLCIAAGLQAATITYFPTERTGGQTVNLEVVFDDAAIDDAILVTANVVPNPADTDTGDIRAIFFNLVGLPLGITPQIVLDSIVGDTITNRTLTSDLGGDPNVTPLGPFTIGLEFGTSGIGKDDYASVAFAITNSAVELANIGAVAARITSIGTGTARGGSGKFLDDDGDFGGGDPPGIPEPTTYALAGSALLVIALVRRKR